MITAPVIRTLFFLFLALAWWSAATLHLCPPSLLPTPAAVGEFLLAALRDGTLIPALLTSLSRVGLGYLISLALGGALGLLLARSPLADATLGSVVTGLQSLPSICWYPLALLWFGITEKAVLFVVVMGAIFAVALAVRAGIRTLPPLWLKAARMLGARGFNLWRRVLLPAILPAFLAGMRQGWAFAWRSLMTAELLSPSLKIGAGHLLSTGRNFNNMPMVVGMIALILALGLLVERVLFLPLDRLVARRWGVEGA